MPESLFKKTEDVAIAANVAIIVVALLPGVVLVKRFLLPGESLALSR